MSIKTPGDTALELFAYESYRTDRAEHESGQIQDFQQATALGFDLLLQKHNRVDKLLRTRRAPGDIDVHRNHLVHGDERVVAEHTGRGGASSHGDDPLGLRHLLIKLADDGRHLV